MSRATLTRAVEFAAGHRYYRADWTEEENLARFGVYAAPTGHGHNYRVEVTLEGNVDTDTGMILDLPDLDELLRRRVVEPFDHTFLNDLPDFADGVRVPTTENIAQAIWERLAPELPGGCALRQVRVREQRNLWADYRGG